MKNIILVTALLLCSMNVFAEVSVIVNPSNESAVDADTIKNIYLGKEQSFSNGTKVNPVNQDGTPVVDEFNDKVVGKSSSQLDAYWSKLVFSGEGTPPEKLTDDKSIIEFVAANPGAIGYISSDKVTDAVKVIATY